MQVTETKLLNYIHNVELKKQWLLSLRQLVEVTGRYLISQSHAPVSSFFSSHLLWHFFWSLHPSLSRHSLSLSHWLIPQGHCLMLFKPRPPTIAWGYSDNRRDTDSMDWSFERRENFPQQRSRLFFFFFFFPELMMENVKNPPWAFGLLSTNMLNRDIWLLKSCGGPEQISALLLMCVNLCYAANLARSSLLMRFLFILIGLLCLKGNG